jgi:hypothetical protein
VLAIALALSLAGLPFTGGALAKAASKPLFAGGLAASLAWASSAGSALLMLHFSTRLPHAAEYDRTTSPARLVRSWPLTAAGALFLPYLPFPFVGAFGDAISLSKNLDALWPVLAGGVLALGLARFANRLPPIPTGDAIIIGEAAFDRSLASGAAFDRVDAIFRRWPAAGLALLAIVLALAYATV